ncbi:MAG: Bax inhibitor-1/YccA family protein [Paramuribaculum sp.]|nr:Bax inhibitor-1/YccA family protein [Paramuribaculum sp.]
MENYQNYYTQSGAALDSKVSAVMKRVYVKMFLALLVTAFVSLFCASSHAVLSFFAAHSGFIWGVFIVELVLVFAISGGINRMSSGTATMLFFLFAIINGLALFPIFIVYTGVSIAKTFFITAGTFGAMSIYGYFTSQDLSKWGSVLIMALFGLIICSVVNIFWANSTFEWIISAAGVLIFVGLTAWDTQKIKQMAAMAPAETVSKLATIGALSLYLDFINLFLYLLRFFGNSRD